MSGMFFSHTPRILIIGDQGQVAWELKRTLAPLGEIIAAGRSSSPVSIDLTRTDLLQELVEKIRPDWIINAAAYTAVDKAEQESDLAMAVNGTAPGLLAQMAKRLGAFLVHYSTDYVFDGTASSPYTEEAAPNPQSVYGRTKLAGEKAIQFEGGEYLILRTGWVYASRGHNFLRTIRRLSREREELRIVADQHGAPTWARHIAEATAHIVARTSINQELRRSCPGIYHMTAGGACSWYDFACRIIDYQRRHEPVLTETISPITTNDYPLPAPRPRYSVLDNTKLRHTFGIALPHWDVALQQVHEELLLEKI
jgi:dTDP-4-dehydrorhamnose reductase